VFWPIGEAVTTARGNCIATSLMVCTSYQILFGWSNQCGLDGRGMQHVWQHDWDKLRVLVKTVTSYTEGGEFLG
jgi:hypothetical protein